MGYADYCQVVNGATVISGWAHDPQAAAGALPNVTVNVTGQPSVTVPSSIAGYRDGPINSYLSAMGIATSSVYSWSATYVGLYKGNSYAVSGTIANVGIGADTALAVNSGAMLMEIQLNHTLSAVKFQIPVW